MATLNLLGLSLGLSVWLFSTLNVPYASDSSHISTFYQEHQNNFNPLSSSSLGSVSPPSTYFGEQLIPSSQSSDKNRRNKNKKQGGKQPASTIHVGGNFSVTASHTGNLSPTPASHVSDTSLASASHVGDMQPTTGSQVGGKQPATAIHVGGKI